MRLTNLAKCNDLCQNLDNLLIDSKSRIGAIKRVHVRANAHEPPLPRDELTTVAFIQLRDSKANEELVFLLNGYTFHGLAIHASRAQYNFPGLDDTYIPHGIECRLCRNFKRDSEARENELVERLLAEEKRRMMMHFPISKSKRAPKPVP